MSNAAARSYICVAWTLSPSVVKASAVSIARLAVSSGGAPPTAFQCADGHSAQIGCAGLVVEAVRPHRSDGHGEAWRVLQANHDAIEAWVEDDLTA